MPKLIEALKHITGGYLKASIAEDAALEEHERQKDLIREQRLSDTQFQKDYLKAYADENIRRESSILEQKETYKKKDELNDLFSSDDFQTKVANNSKIIKGMNPNIDGQELFYNSVMMSVPADRVNEAATRFQGMKPSTSKSKKDEEGEGFGFDDKVLTREFVGNVEKNAGMMNALNDVAITPDSDKSLKAFENHPYINNNTVGAVSKAKDYITDITGNIGMPDITGMLRTEEEQQAAQKVAQTFKILVGYAKPLQGEEGKTMSNSEADRASQIIGDVQSGEIFKDPYKTYLSLIELSQLSQAKAKRKLEALKSGDVAGYLDKLLADGVSPNKLSSDMVELPTVADYPNLRSGDMYVDPNGVKRQKR